MAQFHFVEDYERLVDSLLERFPLDEAMERAIGGNFEAGGTRMVSLLRGAGLQSGTSIIDLGCGSGRLAKALGRSGLEVEYLGVDIIQRLLDYAATISPQNYNFIKHQKLSVPADDESAEIICAFSLFTHLLHHETYLYLKDCFRVLKSGGRVVFSFLEFAMPGHWYIFSGTASNAASGTGEHLDTFIERNAIHVWAADLGFEVVSFDPTIPGDAMSELGQSVVILKKPDQS